MFSQEIYKQHLLVSKQPSALQGLNVSMSVLVI